MMHPASKKVPLAGILLLGGIAGLVPFGRAAASAPDIVPAEYATSPEPAAALPELAQAAAPRFVYGSGFQGVGYQANRGTRPAATRGQSVGPGVRDWTTGRRGRLHKPWLQPR